MELWNYDFPMTTKCGFRSLYQTDLENRNRHLGNAEYPRGFAGGIALKLHRFFPHFEHRIRFSTSANFASHPHCRPSVCGSAVRSWPQTEHLSIKVYCPNSSLSLLIRNSRAIGVNCYDSMARRPSSAQPGETLYKLFATLRGLVKPSARDTRRPASDVRHRIPEGDADYPAIDRRALSLRSFDNADPAAKIAPNREIPPGSLEYHARSIQTKVADAPGGNTTVHSPEAACSTFPTPQTGTGYRPLRQSNDE